MFGVRFPALNDRTLIMECNRKIKFLTNIKVGFKYPLRPKNRCTRNWWFSDDWGWQPNLNIWKLL